MEEWNSTNEFFASDEWQDFKKFILERFTEVDKWLSDFFKQANLADILYWRMQIKDKAPIYPFIIKELKKKRYNNMTMADFMRILDIHKKPLFMEVLDKAIAAFENKAISSVKGSTERKLEIRSLETPTTPAIIAKIALEMINRPNTKIFNMLEEGAKSNGERYYFLNGQKENITVDSKKKIETIARIDTPYKEIGTNININEYQRIVHDTIGTISRVYGNKQGECFFTDDDLIDILSGGISKHSKSKKEIQDIQKAIDELSKIRITIDATKELNSGRLKNNEYELKEFSANLLNIERVKFIRKENGKLVNGYHLLNTPIMFRYANATEKIIPSKVSEFYIPDQSSTTTRVAMLSYLQRRLRMAEHNPDYNTVLIDKIFDLAEATRGKTADQRNRDYLKFVLSYWTDQKIIKGYTWRRKTKEKVEAVILNPYPQEKKPGRKN